MGVTELEQYRQQFEEVEEAAKELTSGLTEAQFNWRPASGQWSIEECLSHLTMVGHWEVNALERSIEDARSRGLTGTGPFDYGPIDRYVVHMSGLPVRLQMPAAKRFIPLHGQPVTAILPTFLHVQSRFLLNLDRAEGLDLARVKVPSPISRFFKMSLGMAFAQAAAHERRHIEQARKVRDRLPK